MQQVELVISILLTDVDNIFSHYFQLTEFRNSGYDVIHLYAICFPEFLYINHGFVVRGCLT